VISRIATHPGKKHCNQCYKWLPRAQFVRPSGREAEKNCNACAEKYKGWSGKTAAEKLATRAPRKDPAVTGRVVFVRRSMNRKLGPIPVAYSERATCPPACAFYEAGCYAEVGKDGAHWRGVAAKGIPWGQFLARVRELPAGQLWRMNEAGDLPGRGDDIDGDMVRALVVANKGRRGFTFTHKPVLPTYGWASTLAHQDNAKVIEDAIEDGFTINLSADSLDEADAKADIVAAPVVVVLTGEIPKYTPGGRKLVPCPAQTHAMTCLECQLCAHPRRKSVIAFRAHGQSAALIPELVRRKRAREAVA
jgi:hypothetical protein